MPQESLESLLESVRACRICESHLPLGPRPVVRASAEAKILIVGQAPGLKVHESGVPWNDASGVRLREWLGLTHDEFYDASKVAILPIGFCYPGKGKFGDLPPRAECFPAWHAKLRALLPNIRLSVLIGSHAQRRYLGLLRKKTLTETVKAWEQYQPEYLPLPHPSPLNNIWLHKNRWFEETLPEIKLRVQSQLTASEKSFRA